MPVPLLDLKAQWKQVGEEIIAAMQPTYESQYFIMGPPVKQFEDEVAKYCGSKHAIGNASGSDAIILALMACGVGPGDEVIIPTFTFFATAGAVSRIGAIPLFADVDPVSFNMPASEIDRLATDKTKAVIPVHLFGQCCDMDSIMEAATRHNLYVIEDAAQSIGAKYKGKRVGQTGGHIATFSFFPSKNLGCMGDGGMCVTDDDDHAHTMRILRNHGMEPKYYHSHIGMNSRLDALQAAALSVKLRYLEEWHQGRRDNAADYNQRLSEVSGLTTPAIASYLNDPANSSDGTDYHIYNQYTLRVSDGRRDELLQGLRDRQIGCEVYYPVCLHLQECYADLGGKPGELPHAEKAAEEVLSIPVYPELSADQRDDVVAAVKEILSSGSAGA